MCLQKILVIGTKFN
jgi:hypothetical protein